MEDHDIRAALDRHWAASDANDFEAEHKIYRENALLSKALSQRRDLGLQAVLLDDPARPDAFHERILADHRSACLDQHHQHVERAPAELQRPAIGEELAAVRQDPETAEFDRCRRYWDGFHI
jgi:hypothetical protein